jgi:hypothetical protein
MSASAKEETGRAILRARIRGRCFRHHAAALRRHGRRGATVAGRLVSVDLRAPARVPAMPRTPVRGLTSRRDQAAASRKARLAQAGRTIPPCPVERRGQQLALLHGAATANAAFMASFTCSKTELERPRASSIESTVASEYSQIFGPR